MTRIFSLFIFLFLSQLSYSQTEDNEYSDDEETTEFKGIKDEKKKLDLSRFRVGGDVAIGFASNTFFAEVSPLIGYQIIKDRLEVGPGLIYQHQSEADRYSFNNFGGQAYVRGYIFDGIFAQVDGFLVNYNYNQYGGTKSSFTYGNGFVGAGYAFNHKEAPFYMIISVKTNMVTDKYYPKRLIIPKIGFQFKI